MAKEKKEVKKAEVDPHTRRMNLTFLHLIFPPFLLALIPSTINGNAIFPTVLKLLVFIYCYINTKNFVNSMYN